MVMGELELTTDLLVIGGGPGGYTAAFRAADLGLDVTMVDAARRPGGRYLFGGCLASKSLLFLAELITDSRRAGAMGIRFSRPHIDLQALRAWIDRVVDNRANQLVQLCEKRSVQLIRGRAEFESAEQVRLHRSDVRRIRFKRCILATGSHPAAFPGLSYKTGDRIMNPGQALSLAGIPENLLVLGAGYAALELGTVHAALGSRVHLVQGGDDLLPDLDRDLLVPLQHRLETCFSAIHMNTRPIALEETGSGVQVDFQGSLNAGNRIYDQVLVAIGRQPNTEGIGLENTGVALDENGFVVVDDQQKTTDPRILAVGDVAGGRLLAHKAAREGKVAAEVVAGYPSAFDARAIPVVVYTDPQVACCGLSEMQARRENREIRIHRLPWHHSDRAATLESPQGLTKILADPESGRVLGVGICGRQAENLIAEGVLAVEMGVLVEDLALSMHPQPTLSEMQGEAAEMFMGSATHIISGD